MLTVIDIAIGLVFIYITCALFCTAAQEIIAQWLNTRGEVLKRAIAEMLTGLESGKFWDQPSVKVALKAVVSESDKELVPSHLPKQLFSRGVLELIGSVGPHLKDAKALLAKVDELPESAVKTRLQEALNRAGATVSSVTKELEDWFEQSMAAASQWFTRWAQRNTVLVGIAFCAVLNVDTLLMMQTLRDNPTFRASTVERAIELAKKADIPAPVDVATFDQVRNKIQEEASIIEPWPKWYGDHPYELSLGGLFQLLAKIVGILLSGLAVSLGARFWFDTLKELVSLRTGGLSIGGKTKSK